MNSGYVVTIDPYGETVDDATQAGQQTTDGSWDWLAKPGDPDSVWVSKDTPNEREVEYLYGEATWTTRSDDEIVTVTADGDIRTREERTTERHAAEFLLAPGEKIGVVSDLGAVYHIEELFTALDIAETELDLRSLVDDLDVNQWGVGFAGRQVGDGGEKGALYGQKIEEDPDLGEELQRTPLSDVGFEHTYDYEPLKAYLAASGYVAAYGDGWTSTEFLPWLIDVVKPHVRNGDEMDDDQATFEEVDA